MEAARAEDASSKPFHGFSKFVGDHLAVVNAIVAAAGAAVGAMDFLAPKLSVFPAMVYTGTGLLLALMIAAAIAPVAITKLFGLHGFSSRSNDNLPLWRRPVWQFGVAILLMITALGFASVARASEGGFLASKFSEAKRWQASLLSLEADSQEIKRGVAAANGKLDRLTAAVDPDLAADRCADLECAVTGGASPQAVRKLFDKGVKTSGNPLYDGALLVEAVLSSAPGRFEVIDLLVQHGIDRGMLVHPYLTDKAKLSKQGAYFARELGEAARQNDMPHHIKRTFKHFSTGSKELDYWNDMAGCLLRSSGGVSVMELAALIGDTDLYTNMLGKGMKLPQRPLTCDWNVTGKSGSPTIRIDPVTGKASLI